MDELLKAIATLFNTGGDLAGDALFAVALYPD